MDLFEKLDSVFKNLYLIFKKASVKINKISRKRCGAPEGPPSYCWQKSIMIGDQKYILTIEDSSYMTSSSIRLSKFPDRAIDAYINDNDNFVYYIQFFRPIKKTLSKVSNSVELKNGLEISEKELEELISKINLLAIERM